MILEIDEDEVERYKKHSMVLKGRFLTAHEIDAWTSEHIELVAKAVEQLREIGLDLVIDALQEMGIAREPRLWDNDDLD